jgi:hypothetical protein
MSPRSSIFQSKYLKPVVIVGLVFGAGLLSGYFIFRPMSPEPPVAHENPIIYQFRGAFIFEKWGEDDIITPEIDGKSRMTRHVSSLEVLQNFTSSSWCSSYFLNQTTIDWGETPVRIPTTQDVSYNNITVNSSALCDWAIVSEETISDENVTMHRIRSVMRPMGFYQGNGVDSSYSGSPHFVRAGDYLTIENNISDWDAFTPHSIYDDLNVTYNYRIEFFHEVAGQPELLLSVKIPTIEFRLWDDPDYITGLNRDLTINVTCFYFAIVDSTNNYPSVFSSPHRFDYNLTAFYTYH